MLIMLSISGTGGVYHSDKKQYNFRNGFIKNITVKKLERK